MTVPVSQARRGGHALRVLYGVMSLRRKRQFWLSLGLMCVGAFLELLTIGAIVPFLAIIADPSSAARFPLLVSFADSLGSRGADLLWPATLVLIAIAAIAAVARLTLTWVSQKFVFRFGHDLGVTIYERMLWQPYSVHVRRNTSDALAAVEKVHFILVGALLPAMQALIGAAICAFIAVALVMIDPFVATVAGGMMAAVYLTVGLLTRRKLRENSFTLSETSAQRIRSVQEGLGGIRDILIDQSQPIFLAAFRRPDLRHRDAQALNAYISSAPRYIIEAVGMVVVALLAVYLSYQPGGLIAALPALGALALGAQRLFPLAQQIYLGWSSFAANAQILSDVAILATAPVSRYERRQTDVVHRRFAHEMVCSKLSYSYVEADRPAIRALDLTIAKGARVGLIGKTGSGKSTLIDLLMGLLEPSSGEIRIDGRRLDHATQADWQAQIAHVPQAIYLSDSSIAANIAFGRSVDEIDIERVHAAAIAAEIDDYIRDLPEGYYTRVGERGVRLSGGQRQRIGLARALYKRAEVLILDEATSALDDQTEAAVMASIERLGRDVTVLMVAHRITTLAGCDFIVRMEEGRIVETGSYDEIIAPSSTQRQVAG